MSGWLWVFGLGAGAYALSRPSAPAAVVPELVAVEAAIDKEIADPNTTPQRRGLLRFGKATAAEISASPMSVAQKRRQAQELALVLSPGKEAAIAAHPALAPKPGMRAVGRRPAPKPVIRRKGIGFVDKTPQHEVRVRPTGPAPSGVLYLDSVDEDLEDEGSDFEVVQPRLSRAEQIEDLRVRANALDAGVSAAEAQAAALNDRALALDDDLDFEDDDYDDGIDDDFDDGVDDDYGFSEVE